jgi:hypothetical protein
MDIVILALAVFRTANLIALEDGPANVFERLRNWANSEAQTRGGMYTQFAGLIGCVWCSSVWLGALTTVAHYTMPNLATWLALPFALSAITMILDRWVNG